ncbi:hypothetical protein V7x_28550 [Crateriforma conspicua]|uniref:Uncharacterized protein n=1 Tax=Crateriforma conspicua TaxID=2527996 RepID=A0A5C6FXR5_9PLAN|nr:hypothetical protein V7x_28550 [Crateriforma conspicua]
MQSVELRTAFSWHCPSCRAANFVQPDVADLSDDDAEAAFRRFNDLEPWQPLPSDWQEFEIVTMPPRVTCCRCHREFITQPDAP